MEPTNSNIYVSDNPARFEQLFRACAHPVQIDERHRSAIVSHLQALNADDRYERFSIYMSDSALAEHVSKINFHRDICLGIFETDLRLVGIIHLCIHGKTAELGASVDRQYRYRGYALNLFKVAFVEAIKRGIQEIHLATGHPAACQIAQQLGFKIRKGGSYPKAIICLA